MHEGLTDEDVAWRMTDMLVRTAQTEFEPAWEKSEGDTGWVSFELDPLLEDVDNDMAVATKASQYIELGKQWAEGHKNRMIKVPATPGGIAALEELAAAGVTLNVTLLFSDKQYFAARDAIWRGAQRAGKLGTFKSVYSIFISRIDVYTKKHVPELSEAAQGQVGLVNAKRIWKLNHDFWADKGLKLNQEMIFASTGKKLEGDAEDKYVSALAGSDIQTNPPSTNEAVQQLGGKTFSRTVDTFPPQEVLDEIDAKVDFQKLEDVLMEEGLKKFADPQKKLLSLIAKKREELAPATA
jgi:transaldolase